MPCSTSYTRRYVTFRSTRARSANGSVRLSIFYERQCVRTRGFGPGPFTLPAQMTVSIWNRPMIRYRSGRWRNGSMAAGRRRTCSADPGRGLRRRHGPRSFSGLRTSASGTATAQLRMAAAAAAIATGSVVGGGGETKIDDRTSRANSTVSRLGGTRATIERYGGGGDGRRARGCRRTAGGGCTDGAGVVVVGHFLPGGGRRRTHVLSPACRRRRRYAGTSRARCLSVTVAGRNQTFAESGRTATEGGPADTSACALKSDLGGSGVQ